MLNCFSASASSSTGSMLFKACLSTSCLFLLLIDSAYSSGVGSCPEYPPIKEFNIIRLLGQWHEIEKTSNLAEIAFSCTSLKFQSVDSYKVSPDNDFKFGVSIETINRVTGIPSVVLGYATSESRGSSIMDFELITSLPQAIAVLLPVSDKYQILSTDYDNFFVLWTCGSLGSLVYSDNIWLFGRNRDFTVEQRMDIYNNLRKLDLEPDRLVLSPAKNCSQTA